MASKRIKMIKNDIVENIAVWDAAEMGAQDWWNSLEANGYTLEEAAEDDDASPGDPIQDGE